MDNIDAPPQPVGSADASSTLHLPRLAFLLAVGLVCCLALTLAFVWLANGIFSDRFLHLDDSIIVQLHAAAGSRLDWPMYALTTIGDPYVVAVVYLVVGVLALSRRRWIDFAGVIAVGAGTPLINQLLKISYQRVRPDLIDGPFELTTYSFPSGHAMGSIACYGFLAFLIVRVLRRPMHRALVIVGAALLIVLIGVSRVYFGVHFPTDILGGYIAGTAWLVATILTLHTAEWYVAHRSTRRGSVSIHTN